MHWTASRAREGFRVQQLVRRPMCLNQAVSELTTYCLWSACNLHFMRFPAVQSEEEKVLLTLSCWD